MRLRGRGVARDVASSLREWVRPAPAVTIAAPPPAAVAELELQVSALRAQVDGFGAESAALAASHAALVRQLAEVRAALDHAHGPIADRLATLEAAGIEAAAERAAFGERLDVVTADLDLAAALAAPGPETLQLPPGGRRVISHGDGRRAICSLAGGTYLELLALSAPTLDAYGRAWGWDVVLSNEVHFAEGHPLSWAKIPLLRELLDRYETIWWIDADAIIVDLTRDVSTVLRPGKDLYVVEHTFEWDYGSGMRTQRFPSAGVFLIRSTDRARVILDALWAREDLRDSHWWENTALLEMIGYGFDPVGPRETTEWLDAIEFVDKAWNSLDDLDESDDPVVRHHAGNAPYPERRRRMLADLVAFRRGLAAPMCSAPGPSSHDA